MIHSLDKSRRKGLLFFTLGILVVLGIIALTYAGPRPSSESDDPIQRLINSGNPPLSAEDKEAAVQTITTSGQGTLSETEKTDAINEIINSGFQQ